MNATQTIALVDQQKRSVLNAIRAAQSSKSIRDLTRAKRANIPSWARPLVRNEINKLNFWAEHKAETIIKAQIEQIKKAPIEDRENVLQAAMRDWQHLNGHFPRLAQQTQRFCATFRHEKAQTDIDPREAVACALSVISKKALGIEANHDLIQAERAQAHHEEMPTQDKPTRDIPKN